MLPFATISDIIIVETAYPFTSDDKDGYENVIRVEERPGYPFAPENQARMLADIMTIVRAIPNEHGLGIMDSCSRQWLGTSPSNFREQLGESGAV